MTRYQRVGLLRRLWRGLWAAVKRGALGKSGHDYMKQFLGGDAYCGRVSAAHPFSPRQQSPQPDRDRGRSTGDGLAGPTPGAHATVSGLFQPEEEPVHGWTKRQLDDYLLRNPGYRPAYGAALEQCRHATRIH